MNNLRTYMVPNFHKTLFLYNNSFRVVKNQVFNFFRKQTLCLNLNKFNKSHTMHNLSLSLLHNFNILIPILFIHTMIRWQYSSNSNNFSSINNYFNNKIRISILLHYCNNKDPIFKLLLFNLII